VLSGNYGLLDERSGKVQLKIEKAIHAPFVGYIP